MEITETTETPEPNQKPETPEPTETTETPEPNQKPETTETTEPEPDEEQETETVFGISRRAAHIDALSRVLVQDDFSNGSKWKSQTANANSSVAFEDNMAKIKGSGKCKRGFCGILEIIQHKDC